MKTLGWIGSFSLTLATACSAPLPVDPPEDGGPTPRGDITTDGGIMKPPLPPAPELYRGDAGMDTMCTRVTLEAEPDPARMHIVLDRSGSMNIGTETGTRWTDATSVLEDVTSALEPQLDFGLTLFPEDGDDQCAEGDVTGAAEVMSDVDISETIASAEPGGLTPTGATLRALLPEIRDLEGRNYVVLVTDGLPNCGNAPDPSTCTCTLEEGCEDAPEYCLDFDGAIDGVYLLNQAGIPTFVVGFQIEGEAQDTLAEMARVGGAADRFFVASNREDLEATLAQVAGSLVSCEYSLDRAIPNAADLRVTIDGQAVTFDAADEGEGFRMLDEQTVELRGEACETLRDGSRHTIDIVHDCLPVVI